ncbi:trypsin-like peptidase domain-containing protein [Streptomyces violarus]|uniref:trypsin-like peptidase domain-containing protein n=1 Tax=Streptomyces violarus TaxID=67380 RepID=UPI0021C0481D|nr:trypsin-like peptidase domain-containing protein [Streptomyces violarus]MCT9139290.1 trypsin-like peptidase domain-containing protein [Streptomyces violarus]
MPYDYGASTSPTANVWAGMLYASPDDAAEWLGTAVLIDDTRLLTCDHVAADIALWVEFPLAEQNDDRRYRIARIEHAPRYDLALLTLAEPAGVVAAPLRHIPPEGLLGGAWSAFGFPVGEPHGNDAYGAIGGSVLGRGFIRLDTHPDARYVLRKGFSGSGVWSAEYQAVVAIVTLERQGDGKAVTIHRAISCFPAAHLDRLTPWTAADTDAVARSAWSLQRDPERVRHWSPRARGVLVESEPGHRFKGRREALTRIVSWLDAPVPDHRVLVVTGAPGAGKSAILGRIVTTADHTLHRRLPTNDTAVRAKPGSVQCAVHAKGKTALEVAGEIARAASVPLPERIDDLLPALRDELTERPRRFTVVIDALDEAGTPIQARAIVTELVLPLAQTCADVGARLIVGTRRYDDAGGLLPMFGLATIKIDLDDQRFFAEEDLAAYALTNLQLRGMERPGSPYADQQTAVGVAARIATLAQQNFLVAGLVARSHGLYDTAPVDPATLAFPGRVDTAVHDFLRRVPAVADVSAAELLTALAFAQAPGLPLPLWRIAVGTLTGATLTDRQLQQFARSSAANFLIRTADDVYQVFHQALNDALLAARREHSTYANDQRALTAAFHAYGTTLGWDSAPEYLLRSLSVHAADGDALDDLLHDVNYLLHADLSRLLTVGEKARVRRDRIRLLRLTPHAVNASPAERLSLLGLTEGLEGSFGQDFRTASQTQPVPYRTVWASCRLRTELATFAEHTDPVTAVCALQGADDRTLLATASERLTVAEATVRIWDPDTTATLHTITLTERIRALCALPRSGGRALLVISSAASLAGGSGAVRIWDPDTATTLRTIRLDEAISAACAVSGPDGPPTLATITAGTVRIWDLTTDTPGHALAHSGWANALCSWTEPDGRILLATADHGHGPIKNSTVRIWDPDTATVIHTLKDPDGVGRMCAWTQSDGRTLLATANAREEVRIWDLATATMVHTLTTASWPRAISTLAGPGGSTLLVTGCNDRTARIWNPGTSAHPGADPGKVDALCPLLRPRASTLLATATRHREVRTWDLETGSVIRTLAEAGKWTSSAATCALPRSGSETLLATVSDDHTVPIWDPDTGTIVRVLTCPGRIRHAWAVRWSDGQTVLVTDSDDRTVRIWDPNTGQVLHALTDDRNHVLAACTVPVASRTLLAISYTDGSVRFWDPGRQKIVGTFTDPAYAFRMCTVPTPDGRILLATVGNDHMVKVRDLRSTGQLLVLPHTDLLNALCVVPGSDGRPLLATGGQNNTVRIWNLSGHELVAIPVHREVLAISVVPTGLAVGMDGGVMVIELPSC